MNKLNLAKLLHNVVRVRPPGRIARFQLIDVRRECKSPHCCEENNFEMPPG